MNITFVGRRFSEAKLLGFAYAYEQATKHRRPPSEINPASWRCVPGPQFDPQGCGPFSGFAGPLTDALIAPTLDLEHLDVVDIKRRFAAGTLTSAQLVKAYIDRVHYVNNQGPGINPVRVLNPAAAGEAAAADAARAAGTPAGPLAGIPVLVNDTIDVAGLPTTAGALALKDLVPARDAALVTRLKAAGAIVLGKVNVTELNGMVATGMPAGYGSLHGQVLNPYDVRTSTNGSSGGAAAAAASGLAAATVGVDTDAVTNGTNNATNSASISALAPPRLPARLPCARRSGSSRAPASCRPRAARTRRPRSGGRSPTSPRCCRASSAATLPTRRPRAPRRLLPTTPPGSPRRRWPASGSA